MPPGHALTITPSEDHVEVVVNGIIVAETNRPVRLDETGLPTRYYLRRDDVRMELLRATNFQTTCPFKGQASYWSLDLENDVLDGVVWSYETPLPGAAAIAGLMCFYPERVQMRVS